MRCPSCHDEYEDAVTTCSSCGVPLVGDDVPLDAAIAAAARPAARLGTFDAVVVPAVVAVLEEHGIVHDTRTTSRGVEVLVPIAWRDDLRTELTLNWSEVVRRLDETDVLAVLALGGSAPGWRDAPRGGYVDRAGRLVVAVDDDEAEDDAARVVGPALLTIGAVLVVLGWYVLDSAGVIAAGIALALAGLVVPR
jgi:hypothetical protein